jgi:hypothetical protein
MSKFRIDANIVGEGTKVWVDDEEQQGLVGLELHVGIREPTQLVLYRMAEGTVEGEALVSYVTPQELRPLVQKWLESLDYRAIEAKAMEGMGWGDGNLVQAVLNTLITEATNAD